jgi:hypothetical protein
VRLQSRATSQETQVFLARGGGGEGAVKEYNLALRKGMDVQEVAVKCRLEREGMRALAVSTVAALAQDQIP